MSTWIYLECADHDPPISADGESGQHLYDLPDIREDIRRRAEWTPERVDECGDAHWFRRNSRRFLAQHPHCRIVIRDEYGNEHPAESVMWRATRHRHILAGPWREVPDAD